MKKHHARYNLFCPPPTLSLARSGPHYHSKIATGGDQATLRAATIDWSRECSPRPPVIEPGRANLPPGAVELYAWQGFKIKSRVQTQVSYRSKWIWEHGTKSKNDQNFVNCRQCKTSTCIERLDKASEVFDVSTVIGWIISRVRFGGIQQFNGIAFVLLKTTYRPKHTQAMYKHNIQNNFVCLCHLTIDVPRKWQWLEYYYRS